MRKIYAVLAGVALGLASNICTAQEESSGQAAPDSIVQITAEAEGLSQVDPTTLPLIAPCWWTVFPDSGPLPMPCPPQDLSVPIYEMDDGTYLVDETGGTVSVSVPQTGGTRAMTTSAVASAIDRQGNAIADLIEQTQERQFEHSMVMAFGMDLPAPGDGGGDDSGTNSFSASYSMPDYGTNLWIAQTSITNGSLAGIGTNTLADIQYEIQSRTNLAQTDWQSEGFIVGSESNSWTPLSVAQNGRTNLFIRLRSLADTANIGIPDWWQLQYFGYVGVDPYGNPTGDGLSNLYKYQNNLDPTVFITPPAPDNFVAILNTNGTDVRLTWNVAQGGVTNYTITRAVYDSDIGDYVFSPVAVVGANTNAFVQLGAIATADDLGDYYEIAANYPGGNTSDGSFSQIYPDYYVPPAPPAPPYDIVVTASLIRNSTGRWQLMFPALPTTAQNINLIWTDTNGVASTQSIPGSALTNGIYQIADTNALAHLGAAISVQGVGASGELGKIAPAGTLANDAPCFVDGSEHLKQNLLFQLRAATVSQPNVLPYEYNAFVTPEYPRASVPVDANYVESGIFHWSTLSDGSGCTDYMKMDDLWPFTVNYEFHQYLFDPNYTGSSSFHWTNNLATVPAPAVLGLSDPFWILLSLSFYFEPCSGVAINPADGLPVNPITIDPAAEVGGFVSGSDFNLQSGTHNLYGLAFETALIISSGADPVTNTLALDSSTSVTNVNTFYTQTVLPSLQFVNYYFAPVNTPGAAPSGSLGQVQAYPLPALTNFASTNLTKTIIASVGQPIVIGGWEKFSILNGGSGKRAYLGQYFVTNAYLLDASGNLTATNAGVLSPYGEFFPTQAGKAQLVTVPDSGRQGTCTVSVISLNLDANHDGAMDLSYFGQDQTSPGKPYVFWCNNNFDRWDDDFPFGTREMDDVLAGGQDISNEDPNNSDNNYHSFYGQRAIPTTRDLEDFSRLGVTGLTPDLYSNLPAGSTVTFNWGDVASPNPANPTIDIFSADAGLDYLTNETEAADVVTHSALKYIGRVSPGQSVPLDPFNISILGHSHFIWCGVTNGSGKLSLTFKDAQGNTFGEASVYIQIVDVKQMYERWTVGDNPGVTPNPVAILAQNGLSNGQRAFQYGPPATNTTYILHVHGYNMPITAKDSFGSTAFKRLFWQGYQGRFGTFYWPTAQNAVQFGGSEAQAWLSGQGLLNKLIALKIQYPGHVYLLAHSLGNVVAGEALRLAGTNQLVNTYVAMQGAITAHAYDPTTTPYTLTEDWGAPDCYAHYWTSGAPCYFNSSVGAGLYVNFYNTNDWALNFWLTFQNSKPVLDLNYSFSPPDSYFKNSGSTELFFPADTYELFDEIIQSRSYALGAQANVAGAFKTLTDNQVALPSVWPPDLGNYSAHVWHSAEFRSDNAQRWQFWNAVLVRMGLK